RAPRKAGMRRYQALELPPNPRLEALMQRFSRIPLVSVFALLLLLVLERFALPAERPGRVSPPPQFGFQPGAPELPAYVPDRALMKLTEQAQQPSRAPPSSRFA